MAYAGANGRLTAAPQELLSVAVAPFQRAAAAVSSGVASLWENYANIDAILEENQQLSEENASLRSQMVDYDKLKAENEAYKALANIQEQHPEMSYTSSFVIGRDPLDSFWGFTLDRGTLDGVAVNDAVISDEGYLLGVVREADLTSCKIMTILHPSFNAAGVVSRTRDNGIITGSADYAADGLCILSNLARSTLSRDGGPGHHHGSGRGVPAGRAGGRHQGADPRGQRQIDAGRHPAGRRPPHGAPCVHHHQLLRRAGDGISPQAQPQPDPEVVLLCAGPVCVCGAADHAGAVPAGSGKAAAAAAALSGRVGV